MISCIKCEHEFDITGYTEENYIKDTTRFEEMCSKCGLIQWYEV